MRVTKFICDVCWAEEIEDDTQGWHETAIGRDLCADCARRYVHRKTERLVDTVNT